MHLGSMKAVAVQNLEKLINEKELVQITPEGYSMYPLMVPGRDQVVIKKTDPERIRRGQVWLYRRPSGMLVLHRVWKVCKDGVYMVEAPWLVRIMAQVNMDDYESLQYFQRVLISSGIIDALREKGVEEGDIVSIYDFEFEFVN